MFKACNVSAIKSDVCLMNGESYKSLLGGKDVGIKLLLSESDHRVKTPPPLTLLLGIFLTHLGSCFFNLQNEDNGTFEKDSVCGLIK